MPQRTGTKRFRRSSAPVKVSFYHPWGLAYEIGTWEGGWSEEEARVDIGGTHMSKWQKVGEKCLIKAEVFAPTRCKGTSDRDARPRTSVVRADALADLFIPIQHDVEVVAIAKGVVF